MSDSQNWKPKGNPWLIALVVTLAAFMEILVPVHVGARLDQQPYTFESTAFGRIVQWRGVVRLVMSV